jgi:hypothetical protein
MPPMGEQSECACPNGRNSSKRLAKYHVTGPDLDAIERLSPGGWTDCPAPSGEGIMLLAGTGDSWTHLGVRRQSPDGS